MMPPESLGWSQIGDVLNIMTTTFIGQEDSVEFRKGRGRDKKPRKKRKGLGQQIKTVHRKVKREIAIERAKGKARETGSALARTARNVATGVAVLGTGALALKRGSSVIKDAAKGAKILGTKIQQFKNRNLKRLPPSLGTDPLNLKSKRKR